jgi:hypothetical protein
MPNANHGIQAIVPHTMVLPATLEVIQRVVSVAPAIPWVGRWDDAEERNTASPTQNTSNSES